MGPNERVLTGLDGVNVAAVLRTSDNAYNKSGSYTRNISRHGMHPRCLLGNEFPASDRLVVASCGKEQSREVA